MMNRMHYTDMSCGAFASCANAAFSCAYTASMQSANLNALFLDAGILASIIICIICGMVINLSVSVLITLVLAAAVLVICNRVSLPRRRMADELL